jgi:hypothetical protein
MVQGGPRWSRYGQIIEDIREVLKFLHSCRIKHIERKVNSAAHGLRKFEVNKIIDKVRIEKIPCYIRRVVFIEHSAIVV